MEDALRTERETRKFRLLALLVVAVAMYFQRSAVPLWPTVGLALAYLVYLTILLYSLGRHIPVRWLPYATLVVDVAFVSGVLNSFGVESAFFAVLPVLIIYYAIYLGYAGSLLCATLIAFSYIALAYLQQADAGLGRLLPMQIPLFYLVALFSGYLAQRRLHEEKERQELTLLLQAERGARAMLDVTLSVSSILDIEQIQRQIVELTVRAANCTHGAIVMPDETGKLSWPAATFPEMARPSVANGQRESDGVVRLQREVLEKGTWLEINGVQPESLLPLWARGLAPNYVLLVPLAGDNGFRGVLWLLSAAPHGGLGETQSDLVRKLVSFFVPLITNARAYAAARKGSERLSSELRGTVQQIERAQLLQKKSDVRVGQLRLEPDGEEAWLGSRRLELSAREFDVLYLLARHAGQPVNQEVLLREVWGDQRQTRSNVVDVSINRLRRKLASQAGAGDIVQTVRGQGYKLDEVAASSTREEPIKETSGPRPNHSQKGTLLLEHVISLAVVAILVPALLAVLTTFVNNSDIYHDRVVALEVAQSQVESVQRENFQSSPASYTPLSLLPTGYSIAVTNGEATRYTYANGSVAPEVLQAITVTVTGRYGSVQAVGYKYRR